MYTKWNSKFGVHIIGLSEEGQKKETLIFPAIIDGYNVRGIESTFGLESSDTIYITNTSVVYFPGTYVQPHTIQYKLSEDITSLSIYVGSNGFYLSNKYNTNEGKKYP